MIYLLEEQVASIEATLGVTLDQSTLGELDNYVPSQFLICLG